MSDELDTDWQFDNGLRILVNPIFGSSSMIESAPSYHRICDTIDWMQENCDFPHYWHILWPEYDPGEIRYQYHFQNTEAQNRIHLYDNVELIRCKFHATQTIDMDMCTRELRELVNIAEGTRFYDVIWNDAPAATNGLMTQVRMSRSSDDVLPPIVNEMQIVPREEKSFSDYSQLQMLTGLAGPNTWTLYEREDQQKLTEKVMRQYLRPDVVQEIQSKSTAQPQGLDIPRLDDVVENHDRQESPILMHYGSKIYSQRNYEEAWEIADTAIASGLDVEMQVVTPNMSPWAQNSEGEYSGSIDHFNVYQNLTKQEMLEQARKASILVDGMKELYEFNLTLGEVVYLGALPVVRDANWSRHMYGEDYPFTYTNKSQGKKLLIHVIKNLDEYREEWIPKLRQRFRDKLSFSRYAETRLDIWNELREHQTFEGSFYDMPKYSERHGADPRGKAVVECLHRMDDQFTMDEFAEVYQGISDNDIELLDPLDGRKPTEHVRYYWMLKRNGVVDQCTDDRPLLDKTGCELVS